MIAKRSVRKTGSRYTRLIHYLLRDGQPTLESSQAIEYTKISHCEMDDMDLAIKEIEAVQAQNTRSKIDRTYHLIISFPADEKPTPEQFCKDLGLNPGQGDRMSR